MSQYEAFMTKINKGLTKMFKRFNIFVINLQLYDKIYEKKEVNLKILLTLSDYLEHKVAVIREVEILTKYLLKSCIKF